MVEPVGNQASPPISNPWGRGQMPSLDGWRAVSILLVLGSHSAHTHDFPQNWAPAFSLLFNGDLGVRCFFIISGFLITTLMLREVAASGKLDLKGFYIRRAIRILPVYFAFLFVVALLQLFTAYVQPQQQWFHLLSFTANFSTFGTWLTGHTWSLSSEEQFYVIWPGLFVAMGFSAGGRKVWACFLLIAALCPVWRVITYLKVFPGSPWFTTFALLNYLDSLAIGCLLAFVHPRLGPLFLRPSKGLLIVAGLSSVIVPEILNRLFLFGKLMLPLGPLIQAAGLATLISASIHLAQSGAFRLLNLPPIMWLGRLSYSLYLWQQTFCSHPGVFGWKSPWFQSFAYWIPVSLAVASFSYYLLERPLLSLRKRLHKTPVF